MTEVSHPPRRWPRALALIAISLALHLLAVDWGKRHLATQAPQEDPAITVELRPLPPPQEPVKLPVAKPAPAKPDTPEKAAPPKRRAAPVPASTEPPDEPIRETVETIVAPPAPGAGPMAAAAAVPGTAGSPGADDGQAGNSRSLEAAAPADGIRYETAPPPSARLGYDVLYRSPDFPNAAHGSAVLDWKNGGQDYRIDGATKAMFFTLLEFSSSGTLDGFGVSPELYNERARRKAATNTHFHRERDQISFSASSATYPRRGGEQDRASVLFQLSAIGRGEAGRFQPGAVIDLFVAGVRDGEVWRIQVVGEETIRLPIGELRAWHVARMPTPGSYDKRIDIWLAPQREWYPARVLYTDLRPDGDTIDLQLSDIRTPQPTAPAAAVNDGNN